MGTKTPINKEDFFGEIQRLQELINSKINAQSSTNIPDDAKLELAELMNLFHDIEKSKNLILLSNLETAVNNLLLNPPHVDFSKKIREEMQKNLLEINIFKPNSPLYLLFSGVSLFIILAVLFGKKMGPVVNAFDNWGFDENLLVPICIAGLSGAIASILSRLKDFVYISNVKSYSLFFTGLFKPILGIVFAVFLFTILESELVSFIEIEKTDTLTYMAIGFIAGFSERFAQDIIAKTEEKIAA